MYDNKIQNILKKNPHIQDILRKTLYDILIKEVESKSNEITKQDCIDYSDILISDVTIEYINKGIPIYFQLQNLLGYKLEPAPDKWDRLFNIDFFIKIKDKYIGLQIKPVSTQSGIQIPEIYKERNIQDKTHIKFTKQYGGKVFFIYSTKINGKKEILNKEVIDEIKSEIERLGK